MSIMADVRAKMIEALKSGDKNSKAVYSTILNALTNKAKDLRCETLTPEVELEVINKLVKQVKESIDTCPDSRVETKGKLRFELDIISQYMPKQMTSDEVNSVIDDVLSELGLNRETVTIKHKGQIMKILMPKIKGKADGKLVNDLVGKVINK